MAKNKMTAVKAVGVGIGVAALAAAGYLLFGPEGKKNRRKIRSWTVKMKGEILEKMEEAKELSEPVYNRIVDEVSKRYAKQKEVSQAELKEAVRELKARWKEVQKAATTPAKKKAR